jgi:mRNA interferase MazF
LRGDRHGDDGAGALELRSRRLPKRSWLKLGQIRTLAVDRIGRKLARASAEELALAIEGLYEIIGE